MVSDKGNCCPKNYFFLISQFSDRFTRSRCVPFFKVMSTNSCSVYFLRHLKKFVLRREIHVQFYHSAIECILAFSICV